MADSYLIEGYVFQNRGAFKKGKIMIFAVFRSEQALREP